MVYIVLIDGKVGRPGTGFLLLEIRQKMEVKKLQFFFPFSYFFINRLVENAEKDLKIFGKSACMLKIKPALLHSQSGTTVAQTAKPLVLKDSEQRSLT